MSSKRILPLIVIVIALVLMTIFIVRDSQERKILAYRGVWRLDFH